MKESQFQAVRLFKALGNTLRLRILKRVALAPATPAAIADEFGKTIQNVSQHIRILRDADLVWFKSDGRSMVYMLKAPEVMELVRSAENLAAKRNMGPRKEGSSTDRKENR